jgi:hypothetical protein
MAHYPNDGNDAEQLLAEADRRMYKEKRLAKQRRTSNHYSELLRLESAVIN